MQLDLYTTLREKFQTDIQAYLMSTFNLTKSEARAVLYSTLIPKVRDIASYFGVAEVTMRAQRITALRKIIGVDRSKVGRSSVSFVFHGTVINAIFHLMQQKFINIDLIMKGDHNEEV